MTDITYDHYLKKLEEFKKQPYRWEFRYYKTKIEEHISGLRLTARKKSLRKTQVAKWCDAEATRFEKALTAILGKSV